MERVVVVGTSGSGKTTVGKRLAGILGVPHVELDALHWEADWTEAPTDVLRARVEKALEADGWVVDGNYSKVRDLIWPQADTLVWLDYRRSRVMWQVITRTAHRVLTRQELWSGNREDWRAAFSRESIILWAWNTHPKNRRRYLDLLPSSDTEHMTAYRFRTPRRANAWLSRLSTGGP